MGVTEGRMGESNQAEMETQLLREGWRRIDGWMWTSPNNSKVCTLHDAWKQRKTSVQPAVKARPKT